MTLEYLAGKTEDDRRRVARELHDDIGQRLALLVDEADRLRHELHLPKESDRRRFDHLVESARSLAEDLRRVTHRLHPAIIEDLGLVPALRSLADDFGERTGLPVRFSHSAITLSVPVAISTALYRIAQEALRNVAKHAGEATVTISLSQTHDCLALVIADTGVGFTVTHDLGLGLTSMRERSSLLNGTLNISSRPGHGTTVTVHMPVPSISESDVV